MQVCAYHLLVVVFLPKHSMIENVIVASFICKHSFSFICTDGAKTDVTGGLYLFITSAFVHEDKSFGSRLDFYYKKKSLGCPLLSDLQLPRPRLVADIKILK